MQKSDELMKLAKALKGLIVLGCRPSSPAAEAGIRYGDIVLSVNGTPTPDWAAFIKARELCDSRIDLVLFRDGVEQEVTVHLPKRGPVDASELLAELIESRLAFVPASASEDKVEPN